jgi:hypothetical protein
MEAASTWSSVEPGPPGYRPRHPDATVLHQLVYEHLETFLAEARARGDGDGLPRFVERELREFLTCGQLARGFARFRCAPRGPGHHRPQHVPHAGGQGGGVDLPDRHDAKPITATRARPDRRHRRVDRSAHPYAGPTA